MRSRLLMIVFAFSAAPSPVRANCDVLRNLIAHAWERGRADVATRLLAMAPECRMGGQPTTRALPPDDDLAPAEPAIAEPAPSLATLRRAGRVGEAVRTDAYGGAVHALPDIMRAVEAILAVLGTEAAQRSFVSSIVRDRADQERILADPTLRRHASRHSLHMIGAAADIAFFHRRQSMDMLAASARRAIERRLGERASLIEVRVEPYCLHVQINPDRARALITSQVRNLRDAGVVHRAAGVPELTEFRHPTRAEASIAMEDRS